MESPDSSKPTSSTVEPVPVQDSPVFSYISNLSPIQPVKAPPVTQGFPGINSPPLVFTSPQLNPHSQATFLGRPQFHGVSAAKLSRQDESCKSSVAAVNGSENLDSRRKVRATRMITCIQKVRQSDSPRNDQLASPTEASEQFLKDVVNMNSVDPNISPDLSISKSQIDQQADAKASLKESLVSLEGELAKTNGEMVVAPSSITKDTEELHNEDTSINKGALERDEKQGEVVSVDQCLKNENVLTIDRTLTSQDQADSITEDMEARQTEPSDHSAHLPSQTTQIDKDSENIVVAAGAALSGMILEKVPNDPQVFQHRGIRRRCLQFEDAHNKVASNQLARNTSDVESPKSLSSETASTAINRNQVDVTDVTLVPRSSLIPSVNIPKPSGIGLHLNSIINSVQAGSCAVVNVKSAQRVNFNIRGTKSVSMINCHLSDGSTRLSVPSLSENFSVGTNDSRHESHAILSANSASSFSSCILKPSSNSDVLNSMEDQSSSGCKRKFNPENDGGAEEFNRSSPKKKRKKPSDSEDSNGCKRCNCKKSKCLKLYCDCFAAGIYCAEPCACQGCFNRPDYEDTVLETRQQIESRNPLAFAPKVVQHIIEPPAISCGEYGTHFTPASARHKRGCNCKKSMCLKKYCECYQANVGCSDGCRCEGCKNVFGQKGEYGMIKDVFIEKDTNEETDCSLGAGNGLCHTELHNSHNLTPLTPVFEFLKMHQKGGFTSGKYYQSPESALTFLAPYEISPGSPRNLDNNSSVSESTQEILDLVSFDQNLDYGDVETVNERSTASNQHSKMGFLPGISNPPKWINNSQSQCYAGNRYYSPGNPLRWRGSPNTPMAQFTGTKLLPVVEFDNELSNIMQDDTPDILKDTPTPPRTLKVSSPNKKRVSPPHSCLPELGSSSAAGLRTGRKFILKAVPAFPPLTPCIDSKSIDNPRIDSKSNEVQHANDSQSCSVKK